MADNKPLVSVILPTRNRAELLKRAIHSVLAQTYRHLELIVVNDACTDHTREVLAAIDDPRLRVIHRELNQGAAAARNVGIKAAQGEFVAFQDDDDFWLVQKLEKQVSAIQAAGAGAGLCITGFIRLEPKINRYIGGDFYIRLLDYRNGMDPQGPTWSMIATPGWLVRRKVLEQVGGFDERIRSWDDWELGLRLSRVCERIVVDQPLWIQDAQLGGGLTKAERARANDLRIFMHEHAVLWADNRSVQACHWYVIGRGESLYDPPPAGRDAFFRSLRLRPFQLKTWAALAMSYLGQGATQKLTNRIRQMRGA